MFILRKFLPAKGVMHISTDDLKKMLRNSKYQFVDVRTPMEFQANHINGFKNIPLHQLRQRHGELKKERPVVLICATGARSNQAALMLKRLGFSDVINVRGGIYNSFK